MYLKCEGVKEEKNSYFPLVISGSMAIKKWYSRKNISFYAYVIQFHEHYDNNIISARHIWISK